MGMMLDAILVILILVTLFAFTMAAALGFSFVVGFVYQFFRQQGSYSYKQGKKVDVAVEKE